MPSTIPSKRRKIVKPLFQLRRDPEITLAQVVSVKDRRTSTVSTDSHDHNISEDRMEFKLDFPLVKAEPKEEDEDGSTSAKFPPGIMNMIKLERKKTDDGCNVYNSNLYSRRRSVDMSEGEIVSEDEDFSRRESKKRKKRKKLRRRHDSHNRSSSRSSGRSDDYSRRSSRKQRKKRRDENGRSRRRSSSKTGRKSGKYSDDRSVNISSK